MFPELTELLLIGCSIELIWITKIQIKYIDTKNQLADILTKGNFTRDEWNHLLTLFNISHFSSTTLHRSDGKTTSTRIRRRTCHSQITTYDEFDRKNAFVRVFFSLIKPGEDLVWISRSWKDLFQVTIERRNPLKPSRSNYYSGGSWFDLGLLKCGKVDTEKHDRSGKPEQNSWDSLERVDPHREEHLLGRTAHSARNEETDSR